MTEDGSPRPPLPRAAPILAIGVALVLVGGFGLGIYVLRLPGTAVPPSAAPSPETILPAVEPPRPAPTEPAPALPPDRSPTVPPPPGPVPARPEPVVAPEPVISPPPSVPLQAVAPAPPAVVSRHRPPAQRAGPRPVAPPPHKPPAPAIHRRWAIRLGAFQSDDHAKLLIDTLRFHGYPARLTQEHDRNGRGWFVVQTQDYATRGEADAAARLLTEQLHLPAIIFERKAGS